MNLTKPAEFMGDENKQNTADRLKLAGDLWIMSAKGTSKIKLSEMNEPKTVDLKGHCVNWQGYWKNQTMILHFLFLYFRDTKT